MNNLLTNDIAYDHGAFNYKSFYDWAEWVPNREKFKYVHFFDWSLECMCGQSFIFNGKLKEECFKTIEHKLFYIKGRLSSYSVSIEDSTITIFYANSKESRDKFVKWVNELLLFNFGKNQKDRWTIKTEDSMLTIPCTPSLVLKADEEIINYIKT